ncbi:MAG TPA: hypothetical protein VKB13_08140 [Gaiellaceae bacterium]|nr:hypothetical protein [Gaiellaceae bacterium]
MSEHEHTEPEPDERGDDPPEPDDELEPPEPSDDDSMTDAP